MYYEQLNDTSFTMLRFLSEYKNTSWIRFSLLIILFITFVEQPETLDVEQHSHIVHNCLLEKSTSRSYNQASSSCDRTIHTNPSQTGNHEGNLDGDYSPMCISQESFDTEHPISGTPSVCSFSYDKCQINPANYDSSGRKGREMISVPKQLSKSQILFPSSKMLVEKNSKSKYHEFNGRIYN